MKNLTIRNISEDLLEKIKSLARTGRRSMNNEILIVLERGASMEFDQQILGKNPVSKNTQISIWEEIGGKWEDSRSTEEIIKDIVRKRSKGREVNL